MQVFHLSLSWGRSLSRRADLGGHGFMVFFWGGPKNVCERCVDSTTLATVTIALRKGPTITTGSYL